MPGDRLKLWHFHFLLVSRVLQAMRRIIPVFCYGCILFLPQEAMPFGPGTMSQLPEVLILIGLAFLLSCIGWCVGLYWGWKRKKDFTSIIWFSVTGACIGTLLASLISSIVFGNPQYMAGLVYFLPSAAFGGAIGALLVLGTARLFRSRRNRSIERSQIKTHRSH